MATLASISANSIDLETITTLAGILGTTASDVSTVNEKMENELIYNLATEFTCDNISEFTTSENIYTSNKSNTQFFANQLDSSLRSTFDIVTSIGSNDGNFALSTQYIENNAINYDSYSNSLGNNINKAINIIAPTEAIYDSHISITSTDNNGPFYDSDSVFSVTFDENNSNSNIIRALNSKYCTTDNSNPLSVEEYASFNQLYAGNPITNKYYTIDLSSGQPILHNLNVQNKFHTNGYEINYDTTLLNDNSQCGSYKLDCLGAIPELLVSTTTQSPDYPTNSTVSDNLPLFNSTLGLTSNNKLPKNMNYDTYVTLFDENELVGTVPGYSISVIVNESPNSGFVLYDNEENPILSDINNYFSLDNSNLVDNYKYMANYVAGSSSIDFSNASLTITPGLHGESANISNNLLMFQDGDEAISQQEFQNGQIILNIHSVETRVNETSNNGEGQAAMLKTNVVYNNEDGQNGREGIANDVKDNLYVKYTNELVVKNTNNDVNYARSNGATLNLVSNQSLVNDNFNAEDIQFQYNGVVNDDTLQIIKLNVYQNLKTQESGALIDKSTNLPVDNYNVNGYVTNFSSILTANQTLDKIMVDVNLKPVNQLSMYNVASAHGWSLFNFIKDQNTGLVTPINTVSSSFFSANPENATSYSQMPTYWPNIYPGTKYFDESVNNTNEVKTMVSSSDYQINYTISVAPKPTFLTYQPIFYFDAKVNWGMNQVNSQNPAKPWTVNFVENTQMLTNNKETFSVVDPSTYSLQNVSIPYASNISLEHVTVSNDFQCTFNTGFLPYDNLTLQSPVFSVTFNYFLLKYTLNNIELTDATQLVNVIATDVENPINYANISSNIYGLPNNSVLSFDGVLTSDDFKELSFQVFAINDNNTTAALSNVENTTAFYSVPVKVNLNAEYRSDPNVNAPPINGDIIMNFSGTTANPLHSQNGYMFNLIVDSDVTYSVSSFTSNISQLGQALISDFENTYNTLSCSNGYENITNWDTHSFSVQGITDLSGNTVISIFDNSQNTIATISTYDYNYINTQTFITKCSKDVWRIHKYIGYSQEDAVLSTSFIPVNYSIVSNGHVFNNMFSPDTGIYILGNSNTLSLSTIQHVGYIYEFSLLPDYISINLVGQASVVLSPIESLAHQYENENMFSRVLLLSHFRGYYGNQSQNQIYSVNRGQTTARFSTTIDSMVVSQTFNVYYGTNVTVNNLVDNSGQSIGSIGLQLAFNVSLLSSVSNTHYVVGAIGDSVSLVIQNPNFSGFGVENTNTTLANFNLYSFSGLNFNATGGPLYFNSSRLKLRNAVFNDDSAVYSLELIPPTIKLYFSPKYLGNPADYTNWNEEVLLFSEVYENWLEANDGGYGYGTPNNNDNSFMQIRKLQNSSSAESNTFFVVAPAYVLFTQTSNFVHETNMPYVPSVNAAVNKVYRYLPVNFTQYSYNPFGSNTFQYVTGESITISSNTVNVNNIMFNTSPKSIHDYITSPVLSKHEIVVNGNYYKIDLYLGLKNSSSIKIMTIFNDVANNLLSLPSTSSVNGDLHLVESINNNSGAAVSYLQILLTSINNELTLSNVFANPNVNAISDNIYFTVDSFFLQIDTCKLNLPILQGISVNMFTKAEVVDSSGNLFVNVYKYVPVANANNTQSQVKTVFFYTRNVKRIPIPSISVADTVVPDFKSMLNELTVSDVAAVAWEPDSVFNNSNTFVFVSVASLTTQAIAAIGPIILGCDVNGIIKYTLVNKQPLLKIVNKIGMPILEIDANGIIKTHIISTNALILNNSPSVSITNSLSSYPLYSILGNTNEFN